MDKLNKMKGEYESISAPQDLYAEASALFGRERRRKKVWRRALSTAAAAAAIFAAMVNVFPGVAYAVSDMPMLSAVVEVVTLGRYKVEKGYISADISTGQVIGLLDKETEDRLNSVLEENAAVLIAAIEEDIIAYGAEELKMSVTSDYEIKADTDSHLSLDVYVESNLGSTAVNHNYYTVDKAEGTLVSLDGLFREDADYVSVLNGYIKDEISRRNREENGMYWENEEGEFVTVDADTKFYLDEQGSIVICFDKYEIAPGAQGSPEFVIPDEVIKDILK